MSVLFTDLQTAVAARLSADAAFAGPPLLPVLVENIGDLDDQLMKAIDDIVILTLVLTPKAEIGAEFRRATVALIIEISENVAVNRDPNSGTQRPAAEVAAAAWRSLDRWTPADLWTPLVFQHLRVIKPAPRLTWELVFKTSTFTSSN